MSFFSEFAKGITSFNPIGGGLGAALGSAIPSLISGGLDFLGGQQQNAANRRISADQMAFQAYMSNTAYQRSMDDMRKAGLNPILAYKQGGASSPAGAGIPAVNELGGITSSAMQVKQTQENLKNLKAQVDLANSSKLKNDAEASLTRQLTRAEVAKRTHESKTAHEILNQQKITTDRLQKYGSSATGQNLFSAEQMVKRIMDEVRKIIPDWARSTAK